MSLFGLGTFEILVIAVVVLIVFGPKRLPELARLLAQGARMAQDATREIQRQLEMSEWEQKHKKRRSISSKTSSTTKSANAGSDDPYPEYDASTYADGVYEPGNQSKNKNTSTNEETSSTIAEAPESGESNDTPPPYNPEVKSNGGETPQKPTNQPIDDPDKVNDAKRFSREFTD